MEMRVDEWLRKSWDWMGKGLMWRTQDRVMFMFGTAFEIWASFNGVLGESGRRAFHCSDIGSWNDDCVTHPLQ